MSRYFADGLGVPIKTTIGPVGFKVVEMSECASTGFTVASSAGRYTLDKVQYHKEKSIRGQGTYQSLCGELMSLAVAYFKIKATILRKLMSFSIRIRFAFADSLIEPLKPGFSPVL